MKGIVITSKNKMYTGDFEQPLHMSLGKAVGGWIEHVNPEKLPRPYCLICNEDGLLRGLDINITASLLYGWEWHGSPIVGDVVIMKDGWTEEGPDIVGLDDDDIQKVGDVLLRLFRTPEKPKKI